MERAATACVAWIQSHLPHDSLFAVLCGTGNNGGDGLAIVRLLHKAGYGAKAFVLTPETNPSTDRTANLNRLLAIEKELVTYVAPETFITNIPDNIIVIDAILGTGTNRPLDGWIAQFIQQLNRLRNRKIAIDIPSGMMADNVPAINNTVFHADDTLSFQFYKRSFLHPEGGQYTGRIHIIDIGLDKTAIQNTKTQYYITEAGDILRVFRKRSKFSHKGHYGRVLIAGGSYGKVGAIVLSTHAALRAGAGLVTALIPECGYNILQTAVPEAMCITSGEKHIARFSNDIKYDAIGIGPGLGTDNITAAALESFIKAATTPIVLDADALNIIANKPEMLNQIPADSILTPHPGEFTRLFGESTDSMAMTENARMQAIRYNLNIVLKGAHTAVINKDGECWYNNTGNSGMATAGSGDVLTGIITSFVAQGYRPSHAALTGVYIHGLAGDIAAATHSQESMIAGDIIENLGAAFSTMYTDNTNH